MNIKIYPMMKKLFTFLGLAVMAQSTYGQYCNPQTQLPCASGGFYIKQVTSTGATLNVSNTNTSCGTTMPGYSFYTGAGNILNANAGSTGVKLQVVPSLTWSYRCYVWVDWNHDGQFNNVFYNPASSVTDTGELMISSVNLHSAPGVALPIPPKAKDGLTRMRVRMNGILPSTSYGPAGADPCTNLNSMYGEVEDYDLYCNNPCVKIPSVTFSNTNYKGTDVSIVAKGNEKILEYVVDQTFADPGTGNHLINSTTTAIHIPDTFMKTINCNQKYYFHIRGICDTDSHNQSTYYYGPWRTDSFTTDPCCDVPDVSVGNVTSYTALATWGPVTSVQNYEYMIRIDAIEPTKGTITNGNSVFLPGLACSKEYYFFLRALCSPTPLSDWSVDSFLTQPCLSIDNTPVLPPFRLNAYPNPVRDVVTLSVMRGMKLSKGNITVVDMTGKTVMNAEMYEDKLELDVHTLPSGLYMIKYNDGERSETVKINKQ